MPWEIDGRHWHTVARVGRNGKPCRWEGRILGDVIDRIQNQSELFSETDWNSRSVVEIRAAKKSDGWFFHAITGEEWLLKMKFRTARNTFSRDELVRRLDLKPLNDMPELPLYGTEPRVKVRSLRGPWQEIELRVHSYSEIDRPEFWDFIDQAVGGFGKYSKQAQEQTDILQPWKQLGRKWHFARRGFPLGGKVEWEMEVLEELVELLNETAPYGQLLVEQQAGRAAVRAAAARGLGRRADEETRRGPLAPHRSQRPLRPGADYRAGVRRPGRRREDGHGRVADQVPFDRRPPPRRPGGVLEGTPGRA